MSTLYRTITCIACGRRSVLGNASGMDLGRGVPNPMPFEDSVSMRCPCGHRDIYGIQMVETVSYDEPLSDRDLALNVARFSAFE